MELDLRLDCSELAFGNGFPSVFSAFFLPQAEARFANGPWGTICIQEIQTEKYLLRHFLFHVGQTLSLYCQETKKGLQSLINLKGELDYEVNGLKRINLKENEYILFDAHGKPAITTVIPGRICSFFNAYYTPGAYIELLPLFPHFKRDLVKAEEKSFHFLYPAKIARHTVHDDIQAIWLDRYIHTLEKKHIELRLESSLFTLLAQTYTASSQEAISLQEREKAEEAREIILKDIRKHWTSEEIATELLCSVGWLKKAFSKVYGTGMFHFLRKTRMEQAKEMLLRGESLKAVAIEVGMKPRNFPKEFKSFYGYTVTSLKKGQF
jgi:AraC-like DNA-binding protein